MAEGSSVTILGTFSLRYVGSDCAAGLIGEVSFFYHMYGEHGHVSSLIVLSPTDKVLWSKSGDQGDEWQRATVTLFETSFEFQTFKAARYGACYWVPRTPSQDSL